MHKPIAQPDSHEGAHMHVHFVQHLLWRAQSARSGAHEIIGALRPSSTVQCTRPRGLRAART
eukprot:469208-Prymnesium_polylepis.3